MTPWLSIVIPTLNTATQLGATLDALEEARDAGLALELVVVDGGSEDDTVGLAKARGARVLVTTPSRGGQLVAGGAAATGAWLLFLHADTWLEPGWSKAVARFVAEPANEERAAVFRLALDDDGRSARRIERLAAWRCRALGLPYGDQGLLISRAFYCRLGGFRPLSLMEDVDLVRRIGRSRLVFLDERALTSAARYRRDGWLLRPARNLSCLALYFLGLPPHILQRLYA